MKAKNKQAWVSVEDFSNSGQAAESMLKKMKATCGAPRPESNLDLFPAPGLLPGSLHIVCSVPGMGGSAYILNLALELQAKGKNVAVFLTDCAAAEFIFKAICARAQVNAGSLCNRPLGEKAVKNLSAAVKSLARPGLYFHSHLWTDTYNICEGARELAQKLKASGQSLDAVLIDSLNYLAKEEDYGAELQYLRHLAEDIKTGLVCAFAMRETPKMHNGYINLADTRAAGLDETYADSVLSLRRAEYYDRSDITIKGKAALHVTYSRALGLRDLYLLFNSETQTFSRPKPVTYGPIIREELIFPSEEKHGKN